MNAMTAELLESKGDIAIELAVRDKEIERLRSSRDNMTDNLAAALAIVKEHAAEIDRLRTQRDVALDDRDNYLSLSNTQRAEIERQAKEIDRLRADHGNNLVAAHIVGYHERDDEFRLLERELVEARAEIERLREIVTEFVGVAESSVWTTSEPMLFALLQAAREALK
jgi:chromosome segregation ATPase